MNVRDDSLFTVVGDQDLHDNHFDIFHYKGNEHIDMTLPLARHDRRTIHLCRDQCREIAERLLQFANNVTLVLPTDHPFRQ